MNLERLYKKFNEMQVVAKGNATQKQWSRAKRDLDKIWGKR